MQINCITGVIVDNGGTYDQSMWLAGKLLQTCFCNYDLKQKNVFKNTNDCITFPVSNVNTKLCKTLYSQWCNCGMTYDLFVPLV